MSSRATRRQNERAAEKKLAREQKEAARKAEEKAKRAEALRRLEAAKPQVRKQTAVRDAYEARKGDAGATRAIGGTVMACIDTRATLTVRLVSHSARYPVVEGSVEFTVDGRSVLKNTVGAQAFLPLQAGKTVAVTGRVSQPGAGRFREATLVANVVVADLENAHQDLHFTPAFGVAMVVLTPAFFATQQRADLSYSIDDPGARIITARLEVRDRNGLVVRTQALAAPDRSDGVHHMPGWWDGIQDDLQPVTRAMGPYSVRITADGDGHAAQSELPTMPKVATLRMHLDVDRDNVVDSEPANHGAWTWGAHPAGVGAIITVADRLLYTQPAQDVPERSPLVFRWDSAIVEPGAWTASVVVSAPTKMSLHAAKTKNSPPLPIGVPLVLDPHTLTPVLDAASGHIEKRLWMQATNYQANAIDSDWEITITFTYTPPAGAAVAQTAVVRIAPWMMASDTDETDRIFSLAPRGGASIGHELAAVLGANFQPVDVPQGQKPFFRDVMKAGLVDSPHYTRLVLLKQLNEDRVANEVAGVVGLSVRAHGAGVRAGRSGAAVETSQDHGGNLLVSPPVPDYPLGRIIFGQGPGLGLGGGGLLVCNLEAFFRAQRVQAPIELDPTWLNVGHVDEFVSFVPGPGPGWPWRILLASPRLGYALAHAASAQHQAGVPVATLVGQAVAINDASRNLNENFAQLTARLNGQFGPLLPAAGGPLLQPAKVAGYQGDPPCPAGVDGRTVTWPDGASFDARDLASHLTRTYAPDPMQAPVGFHERAIDTAQPLIDAARLSLRQGLQFTPGVDLPEDRIIEVPVLLDWSGHGYVTENPDSVNLLQLNRPVNPLVIVPKPFGPVVAQQYIFETYLQARLTALGLGVHFRNDWDAFHHHEGEIHCGSNQTPVLPLWPARPHWWEQAPH